MFEYEDDLDLFQGLQKGILQEKTEGRRRFSVRLPFSVVEPAQTYAFSSWENQVGCNNISIFTDAFSCSCEMRLSFVRFSTF